MVLEVLRPDFQIELERDQPSTLVDAIRGTEKAKRIWKCESSPHINGTAECCAVSRSQWKSNGSSSSQPQQQPTTVPSSPSDHSTVLLQKLVTQQSQLLAQQGHIIKLLQSQQSTAVSPASSPRDFVQSSSTVSRFIGECLYCHKYGHHIAECRNRLAREDDSCILSQPQPSQTSVAPTAIRTPVATIARIVDSQRDNASSFGSSSSTQPSQRPHNSVYVIDREESSSEFLNSPLSAVRTCRLTVDENKIASCVIGSEVVASLASQILVESFGRDVRPPSAVPSTLIAEDGD